MRPATNEEIAMIKRLAQDEEGSDLYYGDMIPIVLEHINDNVHEPFEDDYIALPGTVKLFIAQSINFFGNAVFGVKSESVSSVSYTYDYNALPSVITDLLSKYGYVSGNKRIKFISAW